MSNNFITKVRKMKLVLSISWRLFLNKNGYVFVIKIVTLSVEPEILAGFLIIGWKAFENKELLKIERTQKRNSELLI
jgi:hypothetical protein